MIKHNEHLLDNLDCFFDLVNGNFNLVRQLLPSLLNVISLINIEGTRVRSKLRPNILIDLNASPRLEVLHSIAEGVRVTGG